MGVQNGKVGGKGDDNIGKYGVEDPWSPGL